MIVFKECILHSAATSGNEDVAIAVVAVALNRAVAVPVHTITGQRMGGLRMHQHQHQRYLNTLHSSTYVCPEPVCAVTALVPSDTHYWPAQLWQQRTYSSLRSPTCELSTSCYNA
ncbi:hypothetical protein TcWFU_003514 [Taenia crassiceps]|uniref:Uncharacterized protein n=1 Tax=Taenia crassiceps TaxID=6207 RepID=A0ABR4Q1C8_9CEST